MPTSIATAFKLRSGGANLFMTTATTQNAKNLLESEGYITPLTIMSPEEIIPFREEFDRLETINGKQASQVGLMNVHNFSPRIWELVSHPRVLAALTDVLGPDLLLLGSHFFCKHPDFSDSYVSWHQDVTYWGLNPPKAVTLWLSIDGADVENGCMRVIPRSHRNGLLPHVEAQSKGNLLSVNQEIDLKLIDESKAVDIELQAGSASLHHGMTIHGSNPNCSNRRRCGLTIRFTTPDVSPSNEPNAVQWRPILIQGEDRHHHFVLDPWPAFTQHRSDRCQSNILSRATDTAQSTNVCPVVRPFSEAEPYEQVEPGDAKFSWVLKKDEIPGLQMGRVELKGPIHKTPATHAEFHQAYLIQSGNGTINLDGESRRLNGPTLVVIPRNTPHSVELQPDEQLCYVFVNQWKL